MRHERKRPDKSAILLSRRSRSAAQSSIIKRPGEIISLRFRVIERKVYVRGGFCTSRRKLHLRHAAVIQSPRELRVLIPFAITRSLRRHLLITKRASRRGAKPGGYAVGMPCGVSAWQSGRERTDGEVVETDETDGIAGDVRKSSGFGPGDLLVEGDIGESGGSVADAFASGDGRCAGGVVEPSPGVCWSGAVGEESEGAQTSAQVALAHCAGTETARTKASEGR